MDARSFHLLRYAAALGLLALALSRAGLEDVAQRLRQSDPGWILLAFLLFNLSQIVGAERMRYYYRRAGRALERAFTLRLAYAGMFCNILVPGGVGGDAYRIAALRSLHGFPVKEGIRLQLSGRASGLLAMLLLALFFAWRMALPQVGALAATGAVLGAGALAIAAYAIAAVRLLREPLLVAAGAAPYSLAAQSLAVLAAAALAAGLGFTDDPSAYLFLFLVAAVAGMLPISVGGLGIREFTFLYGAHVLGLFAAAPLDPAFGVTLALGYFAITLLSSLIGLPWLSSPARATSASSVAATAREGAEGFVGELAAAQAEPALRNG